LQDFRDLDVRRKAHGLALALYRVTGKFPCEELFGSFRNCGDCRVNWSELRRGCGLKGNAELARFCSILMGSASELEYHLLLARDLKSRNQSWHEDIFKRAIEVKQVLAPLISKLHAKKGRSFTAMLKILTY
jgi:four helix bundle protein